MKKLLHTINIGILSIFLSACGGQDDGKPTNSDGTYTLVDGALLKTCTSDGTFIYTPEEAAFLEGCQLVNGVIYLQPHGENISLSTYHLNAIVQINGELHIADSTSLKDLNGLDKLKNVGRLFILYNDTLEDISSLSHLESADDLLINSNPVLKHISLPSLKIVNSEMQIYINKTLELIEFASLEKAGTIGVSSNPELTLADFPSLLYVDKINTGANIKLDNYAQLSAFMD